MRVFFFAGLATHRWLADFAGAASVTASTVITPDSVLGCAVAILCTCLYWDHGDHLAINMSWTLVSLAVVFPISQGIGMAFKRRDAALAEFGNVSVDSSTTHCCMPADICNSGWYRV